MQTSVMPGGEGQPTNFVTRWWRRLKKRQDNLNELAAAHGPVLEVVQQLRDDMFHDVPPDAASILPFDRPEREHRRRAIALARPQDCRWKLRMIW